MAGVNPFLITLLILWVCLLTSEKAAEGTTLEPCAKSPCKPYTIVADKNNCTIYYICFAGIFAATGCDNYTFYDNSAQACKPYNHTDGCPPNSRCPDKHMPFDRELQMPTTTDKVNTIHQKNIASLKWKDTSREAAATTTQTISSTYINNRLGNKSYSQTSATAVTAIIMPATMSTPTMKEQTSTAHLQKSATQISTTNLLITKNPRTTKTEKPNNNLIRNSSIPNQSSTVSLLTSIVSTTLTSEKTQFTTTKVPSIDKTSNFSTTRKMTSTRTSTSKSSSIDVFSTLTMENNTLNQNETAREIGPGKITLTAIGAMVVISGVFVAGLVLAVWWQKYENYTKMTETRYSRLLTEDESTV